MPRSLAEQLQCLLGANLRRLRERNGMTQEEAAETVGVNWRHWQKLEAGEVNVTLKTLAKICEGMGVDIRKLFTPPRSR